jgi:hypothetical protein
MNTALENAKALRAKITDAKSRKGNENILRGWSPVREKLSSLLTEVESLSKAAALLIKNDNVGVLAKHLPTPVELKSLQSKLEKLDKRLADEPENFLDGNVWASTKNQLEGLGKDVQANLTTVWTEYLKSLGQTIDHLEPFAKVEKCTSIINKIKVELGSLDSLALNLPHDPEPFRRAVQHQKEIQKLILQLDLKDVPPAVQKFLKSINTSGVTLDDLTDEILTWLEKKNMLKSFHISAS